VEKEETEEEEFIYEWECDEEEGHLVEDEEYVHTGDLFLHGTPLRTPYLPDFGMSPNTPLYKGSRHTTKDFCRYMMALKQSLAVGDMAYGVIVGSIISFLPRDNVLALCLEEQPSTYKVLQVIKVMADFTTEKLLRTFHFHTCESGCDTFLRGQDFCYYCGGCRWKACTEKCYYRNASDEKISICHHAKQPVTSLYYMPIRDRITRLLESDIKNLFYYDKYRKKNPKVMYVLKLFVCLKVVCMF
jgi:hypothetical protein